MKIVLTGVETNNKGAELMLYAILQEIERRHPHAKVFISKDRVSCGIDSIITSLDLRCIPMRELEKKCHLDGIYRVLHLPYKIMPHKISLGKVDYYLDGSGFRYSDQFLMPFKYISQVEEQLRTLKNEGTRVVLLPQAFGPFEKAESKKMISVLSDNASVIMPREKVSLEYLKKTGVVDMSKVNLFSDFTSLVEGVFPQKYQHLQNAVCLIPNSQMIKKGTISFDSYRDFIETIINYTKSKGLKIYLLNHEGKRDEQLCMKIKELINEDIEIVSGLNALEVKGLISSAYLTISSRFHGVASSLNNCVPCLATSWSHKYKELFNDYQLSDCILPLDDKDKALSMIERFIDLEMNQGIRKHLSEKVLVMQETSKKMWDFVWKN